MKDLKTKIINSKQLSSDYLLLTVENVWQQQILPGQFAEIKVKEVFLRRPFSIFDADQQSISFLIKVVGKATQQLLKYQSGDLLEILLPLGNSFSLTKSKSPLLIGGGCGIAPMHFLAKTFRQSGITPKLLWGEKTAKLIPEEVRSSLENCCKLLLFTEDGSLGEKGLVTSILTELSADMIFACGPTPMLKAIQEKIQTPTEFSLEAYMACGIGACMGCIVQLKDNSFKRVCKDGPVFQGIQLW